MKAAYFAESLGTKHEPSTSPFRDLLPSLTHLERASEVDSAPKPRIAIRWLDDELASASGSDINRPSGCEGPLNSETKSATVFAMSCSRVEGRLSVGHAHSRRQIITAILSLSGRES